MTATQVLRLNEPALTLEVFVQRGRHKTLALRLVDGTGEDAENVTADHSAVIVVGTASPVTWTAEVEDVEEEATFVWRLTPTDTAIEFVELHAEVVITHTESGVTSEIAIGTVVFQ